MNVTESLEDIAEKYRTRIKNIDKNVKQLKLGFMKMTQLKNKIEKRLIEQNQQLFKINKVFENVEKLSSIDSNELDRRVEILRLLLSCIQIDHMQLQHVNMLRDSHKEFITEKETIRKEIYDFLLRLEINSHIKYT